MRAPWLGSGNASPPTSVFVACTTQSGVAEVRMRSTNTDVGGLAVLDSQFRIVMAAFPDLTVSFEPGFVRRDR